ncbi:type II secretion system protein [Vibrio sp. 404]|uniref:Type II secretion system protein n=1 Tax=Vibrio marinisediminis TaxID=2758441 RepID=A0A7W2FPN4_9VIBR|nr:type II secretion system protein [Vibrio marinisediminis]MBA5761839.1 type II secretion system protein [Vibrio marinisediminis]
MENNKKQMGFSLIELVVVMVVIAILAVTTIPRILNFQTDARIAVLESALGSIKAINDQVNVMSNLDYVKARQGHSPDSRLQFIDLNRDGIQQEEQGEWSLIWGYLDNTHMSQAISVQGDLVDLLDGRADYYLGFDRDGSGDPAPGQCWVMYRQPDSAGDTPDYKLESSGC